MNGVHPIPFQRALLEDEAQNAASQYIPWLRREGSETILAENSFARLIAMFSQSMDMGWMRDARLDRYKSAWKDVQGVRTMVHWYRATALLVPKPENIPQKFPDMHAASMRISMPHLLLWGENDTALLPKSYDGLRDLCDDLTILTIPDADHWLHHQVPEKVAAHILHWISAPRNQ
ncbi:MAG: alpha/beta hydrolase [Rhodobacteraceae bacterium]|nr:alpha/beta hydrolase [Paracoccaceae bacterium]